MGYEVIQEENRTYCLLDGELHCEDGPALIDEKGTKWWYSYGVVHRENGPAIKYTNGTKKWCKNGKLHRDNGPAIEWSNGIKSWYINGVRYLEKKYYEEIKCRDCGTIRRSMKTINDYICYCPKCQR